MDVYWTEVPPFRFYMFLWFGAKNYEGETDFQDIFEECWDVNALRLELWDLNHYVE